MSDRRYPFTVTFDGGPVPARLSTPEDAVAGLYLSLPAGELCVSMGCAEGLVRELVAFRELHLDSLSPWEKENGR